MVINPTRAAGLNRLHDFLPQAGIAYARRRNEDDVSHVSGLSTWLMHRLLREAEVIAPVRKQHGDAAEKFVSEIFWRTYFKGYLERRPSIWVDYRAEVRQGRDRLATESGLRARWEAACKGETGLDCYDHWAQQLVSTGYLHNHARMWTASIWIFTLGLPWALGADFFLRHLMDGDPASNTLSWRWVGGLHTRGKHYLARAENIRRYTGGRFDPVGLMNEDADPLDGPPVPEVSPVPLGDAWSQGRVGLILHQDDLSPGLPEPEGIATFHIPDRRSPWTTGRHARAFTDGALADARDRFGTNTHLANEDAVAEWAGAFDALAAPYAPQGPAREALDALQVRLGRPIARIMDPWDTRAWHYTTAGYFKVKKAIPRLLDG
ncbi:Deoxyribodipyrimidine photo-lyase [Rhodobacteraceae bacterium THAF1]|uniref:FAD-binding domain-containing protein n=1 Tax=Palleronia sp. THAF1 TaxID=2587842 RepID=UPI000F3EC9F9|nr:FAD-binding domain-containing protein [Palleronia sp. THAF1]QFU09230.1 Deoxyribodipyrimidine photo-lyase [Palleronia sp. THAF1]VDC27356.1 Deoxyribodipyrimidine photo-lyase [Rhodobacteraceae bacterium THAF1]